MVSLRVSRPPLTQLLQIIPAEKTSNLHENVDPMLVHSMRDGMAGTLEGIPKRADQDNDAIPKIAPKWLKHDRQVSYNLINTIT